jgi:membrane-associated phospholipid phosphatase
LLALDKKVLAAMRTRGHSRIAERVLGNYSLLGEHAACWLALGVTGATVSRGRTARLAWRRGVEATAFAYGLNYAVKLLVRRPRPEIGEPLTPVVSRMSFPSAHATTSFAAAGVYRRAAPAAAPALYTAAALFAFTRPYLGVHYPSDVLAGAALGTLVARAWPR